MCQIDFTITGSSEKSYNIVSAQGRYKLTSEAESVSTWTTPFDIADTQAAQTPDITIEGNYDFSVKIVDSEGIYSDWFVVVGGFKIGDCVPNEAPSVNVAATDYNITLPDNQTSLQAVASDSDGNIVSYLWTKISGGSATIVSPTSANTDVTGMAEDSYVFRCTVTDNDGATAFDNASISVVSGFVISSQTPSNGGTGVMRFRGGPPNTVINLQFDLTIKEYDGFESIDFNSPADVETLNSATLSRLGTVTLDDDGDADSNYSINSGNLSCKVTIVDWGSFTTITMNRSTT